MTMLGPGTLQVIVDDEAIMEVMCSRLEITPTAKPSEMPCTCTTSGTSAVDAVARRLAEIARSMELDTTLVRSYYDRLHTLSPAQQPRREAQWKRERNNWRKR